MIICASDNKKKGGKGKSMETVKTGQVVAAIVIGSGGGLAFLGLLCFILGRVFTLGDKKVDKETFDKEMDKKADRELIEAELAHGVERFNEIKGYMEKNDKTTKRICISQVQIKTMIEKISKEAEGNGIAI